MARLSGLVLETGDNWAIILNSQGEYKKIKTKTLLQVGEVWQEPAGYTIKFALAAAVLLVFLGAAFSILPVVAYAQVSSGVELGLNRWDRVISVRSLNDDGSELLKTVNLQGKSLDQAVEMIVDNAINNSNSESPEIVLNVVTKKANMEQEKQRIMEKMDTKVKQLLDKNNVNKDKRNTDKTNIIDNNEQETSIKPNNDAQSGNNQNLDEGKEIHGQQKPGVNKSDKDANNAGTEKASIINEEEQSEINNGQNIQAKKGKTEAEDKSMLEKNKWKSFWNKLRNHSDKQG